ncbi:hypothetical protein [Hippea jasoniae]|uniref:hypothetical protein n=1 Tax=Hippea jasoniae TaxID=944479 RepID=UPI00054D2A96|nr:hypothetical protein [Hippea jasoniae]
MIYKDFQYAKTVEKLENGKTIRFEIERNGQKAFFNFIKRDISNELTFLPKGKYYDIITPFDYGGIYYTSREILQYFFETFQNWCLDNKIISMFIRFDPCYVFDFDLFSNFMNIRKVNDLIYIDLETEFWKDYSKGRKSDINKISKLNFEVCRVDVDSFYKLYIETMNRNKAHKYFYFDKEVLKSIIYEKFGRVFGIKLDGVLRSAMIVLDNKSTSYYFLGGSVDINLDTNAMLLHQVALKLKKEGKRIFFLGGGRSGVYEFKRRFSKKTLPYYVGEKIFDSKVYDNLVKLTNRFDNDFFPKYREKVI